MAVKKYNKLVRDKIPQIIEAQGKQCKVYVATGEDYQNRLKDKLIEEAKEFFGDDVFDNQEAPEKLAK